MKIRNTIITSSLILVLLVGLMVGVLSQTALAQPAPEVDYQWQVIKSGDDSLLLRADASYSANRTSYDTYRWRLYDSGDLEWTNYSDEPVVNFPSSDIIPGVEYDLEFALMSGTETADTGDDDNGVISSVEHEVGLPDLELRSECREDDAGQKNFLIAQIIPEDVEFPNILDADYEFYQISEDGGVIVTDPSVPDYQYSLGQHRYSYRAQAELNVALEDYIIMVNSDLLDGEEADFCDQLEFKEPNFGYQADGLNISVFVLNPDNETPYSWDFTDDGETEETGAEASYTYDEAGRKTITLSTSQYTDLGNVEKSILMDPGTTHGDQDGDGTDDENDATGDGAGDGEGVDGENVAPVEVEGGLVNCGQTNSDGEIPNWCDWSDFVQLINNLISWLIGLATVVATLLFMYAGFLYLTSGGSESQTDQATAIFSNVAVGFGIILVAWMLVTSIVSLLTGASWIDQNSDLLPISQVDTDSHQALNLKDQNNV